MNKYRALSLYSIGIAGIVTLIDIYINNFNFAVFTLAFIIINMFLFLKLKKYDGEEAKTE